MKKVLSLILVLVMCLSLCGCSKNEDALVGEWAYDDSGKGGFILTASGNAYFESSWSQLVEEGSSYYGTWEVDSGYLIIHKTVQGTPYSIVYRIIDNNTVVNGDTTYYKTNK